MTWEPPSEFEEYRIVRRIGAGAMGHVFLAHDTLLDRPVAIKFISALEIGAAARERFFIEARAVARLSHPNVIAIYRVGEIKQRPYLISEYVRGTLLADIAKPLPWERVLKIGIGLARGLGAAHRRGVLHRDIKPANVMLGEDDEAKLLDFGLAKLVSTGTPNPTEHLETTSAGVTHEALTRDREVDATLSIPAPPGEGRISDRLPSAELPLDTGTSPTQQGGIIGTPLYLAPEAWRGAPAAQASDVYALGSVLYELLVGVAPHAGLTVPELAARVPAEDIAPIASRAANLPTRLAEVIDACLSRVPSRRPSSGDALGDLLETVLGGPPPAHGGSPYRGLSSFEPEHRAMFFGRTTEARSVIERLRTETFVIVAGDSGAGKSSLCRAAVLPAITEKSLAGKRWRATTLIPGVRPADRLETALSEHRSDEGLLLFIDQLEELLTLAEPAQAAMAAERISELVVAASNVRVLASARIDFLGRLASLPGLGEIVGRALFLLGPLGDRGLREAILGPARALGYMFEDPSTVEDLVTSGRRHLPLLQFALAELWDARDAARRVIPAGALAHIGGVAGALARHADGVLAGLPTADLDAVRTILLALVTAEGTRARRGHAELIDLASRRSSRAGAALDTLVRGRLLVAQRADSGDAMYTIAHEALLQGWDVLRGWVSRDAEQRSMRHRIERAAEDWDRRGRPEDTLWNDRLMLEAASIDEGTLPSRAAAFLRASRRNAARRRAWRWAIAVGVPVLAAGVVLGGRLKASHDRDAAVSEARQLFSAALSGRSRLDTLRHDAFAKFDGHAPAEGEKRWREALSATLDVEDAFASLTVRVERILQEDSEHSGARALMSDILFERARLADESGRPLERDDLVRRLGLYSSTNRWNAPARLSIATEPPGATVSLRRYDLSGSRWTESSEINLGAAPVLERDLRPGSALLQFTLPGRAPVRFPVVLPRGEAVSLTVALPLQAAVPPGFAYVPEGNFLYGSAGGEIARSLYVTQPIHTVKTGPYLIAVNETTYGEWIDYLRTLSPDERSQRMPNVKRQGGFGVALSESRDGTYQLTLGTDDHPYVVKEGERIRYLNRKIRPVQDWSKLPVTGVSFNDARAFMAWLHTSGRVPNARPCTEHEWERAARGADGRTFPHGERLEPDDANYDATYGRDDLAFGFDEVGSHPASDSPFGVHDLSGNAWEWTASADDETKPMARGGSFLQDAAIARPENHNPDTPNRHDAFYGIRVCAVPRQ